jgi:hypothetical protein
VAGGGGGKPRVSAQLLVLWSPSPGGLIERSDRNVSGITRISKEPPLLYAETSREGSDVSQRTEYHLTGEARCQNKSPASWPSSHLLLQ